LEEERIVWETATVRSEITEKEALYYALYKKSITYKCMPK
jgi:hypothetical protein